MSRNIPSILECWAGQIIIAVRGLDHSPHKPRSVSRNILSISECWAGQVIIAVRGQDHSAHLSRSVLSQSERQLQFGAGLEATTMGGGGAWTTVRTTLGVYLVKFNPRLINTNSQVWSRVPKPLLQGVCPNRTTVVVLLEDSGNSSSCLLQPLCGTNFQPLRGQQLTFCVVFVASSKSWRTFLPTFQSQPV